MWRCPKCGENIEDQFDSCWKCAGTELCESPANGSVIMQVLVRIVSILGCILWAAVLHIAWQLRGWSDGSGHYETNPFEYLWAACPIVYFVICFWTSFAKQKSRQILSFGIVGHLILAGFVLSIFCMGTTGIIFLVPSLLSGFLWAFMYSGLDHESAA
jgi:hypothetical protein